MDCVDKAALCRQVAFCDPVVFFARLSLRHASLARVVCLNDIIRF